MVNDVGHLRDHLVEGGAVTRRMPVAGQEHLAHEHAVDPHLIRLVGTMPKASVAVARVGSKGFAYGIGGCAVLLRLGLLVQKQDGVAGQEIVQCFPALKPERFPAASTCWSTYFLM
jgi:hypothetical protein